MTQLILVLSTSFTGSRGGVVFSGGDLSRAQRAFQYAAESLFSVLFPSDCRICRQPLTRISNLPVCQECLGGMVPITGPLCATCGEKLLGHRFEGDPAPLCDLCQRAAPRFRKAVAYGAYEGPLRDLVHILKYQRVRSAAAYLGRLLHQAMATVELAEPALAVPVPLWKGKRRERGFNQAEEIARAFLRFRESRGIQLHTALLVRTRETASQTGLTRPQRRANLRGAFAVSQPEKLKGRNVLLVDDVMTTGATASECARVLLRAGAKQVWVATVARATREAASLPEIVRTAAAGWGGTPGHA
ncbi:MAG TPA: ComF family protein [Candidatus Angelobacter sp.]|nr:ComF family protein [Candidatus Angelobacter sp.]